jgi:antitoxin (DNA-binding transcriptional repressor) of toxin-antitoxin stability system
VFNIMKRKVSAREFLHQFAKVHASLEPGESVVVTRHGQALGRFVKEAGAQRMKLPDFGKDASAAGFGPEVGDALLERLLRDEAVS